MFMQFQKVAVAIFLCLPARKNLLYNALLFIVLSEYKIDQIAVKVKEEKTYFFNKSITYRSGLLSFTYPY